MKWKKSRIHANRNTQGRNARLMLQLVQQGYFPRDWYSLRFVASNFRAFRVNDAQRKTDWRDWKERNENKTKKREKSKTFAFSLASYLGSYLFMHLFHDAAAAAAISVSQQLWYWKRKVSQSSVANELKTVISWAKLGRKRTRRVNLNEGRNR